jgi:hypothetical protein
MSIVIVIVLFDWFFMIPQVTAVSETLQSWGNLLAAFTVGLGVFSLAITYVPRVQRREPGEWYHALWMLIVMVVMMIAGFIDIVRLENPIWVWFYKWVKDPIGATYYNLLGYVIVTAAFRAVRVKDIESAIFVVCAFIVMLTNVPIGAVAIPGIDNVGRWLQDYLMVAGARAIYIGFGVSIIILGLRTLLGYERGFLGPGE